MKKVIVSLVIILLLAITFFQYKKYTRLNAPHTYEYSISDQVDGAYYDPAVVKDYYEIAYEVGSFAREQWVNYRIDVLYQDNSSPQSKQATLTYNKMRAAAKELELRLIESKQLKSQGYSNAEIKVMHEKGLSTSDYKLFTAFGSTIYKYGDEDKGIYYMQQKLNEKGYPIRIDGIFNQETKHAVMDFQEKENLFPSGIAGKETLQLLYATKN